MKSMLMFALVAAMGLSSPAWAQMGPHGPELGTVDHAQLMVLLKAAQLDEGQKRQVHQIMVEAREQSEPLVKQVRELREQLSDKMVGGGSLQLSDLAPLRQQIRDLQVQIDDKALGAVIKVRSLLRADQLQRVSDTHAKVKALHAQMEALMGPADEMDRGGSH